MKNSTGKATAGGGGRWELVQLQLEPMLVQSLSLYDITAVSGVQSSPLQAAAFVAPQQKVRGGRQQKGGERYFVTLERNHSVQA